jgi:primosomal protein N' (replication factor Y)
MYANVLFPINAEAFTYLVPDDLATKIKTGSRVLAPFKRKEKVGIVVGISTNLPAPYSHLIKGVKRGDAAETKKAITMKPLKLLLDEESFIPQNILELINWIGQYYMSSSGLALKNAVPSAFFTGRKAGKTRITYDEEIKKPKTIDLTPEQSRALKEINKAVRGVFLLHGVTGSGKTEVYINAIKSLPDDKEAIVLVPEIAITAQMIDRFRSSFDDGIVFYHSGISMGERITLWQKMREGDIKVVIGVRSAVFAPFKNIGLIVIDEEQEASYKQFEGLKYNARDVALARAKLEDFKIVLGSATPSMEAFYNGKNRKFSYIELKHRINKRPLPDVEIIDMTKEDKQTFSFSNKLLDSLKENMGRGCQSLIMLNRRGYSPFPICMDCGYTLKCPACSITLIYHKDTNTLNCHYCGSYLKPKNLCPHCKGTKIKYLGTGTQRVEEELKTLIPELSFQRMDRDTTRKKLSHYKIVKQMEEKKIDVLLGTQMVAKGHDFPDVTLAVVISADIALNLPDFRSSERAFQLFTQLAGRAGRGDVYGNAYIQTYEPEHYVFDYVRNHDYKGFYQREIEFRKELSYPPFSRLIRIVLSFTNKGEAKRIIKIVSNRIKNIPPPLPPTSKGGIEVGIEILGPAPAPIEKIRNLWRWHIVLKGKNAKALRLTASHIIETIKDIKKVKTDVDVDPMNLL